MQAENKKSVLVAMSGGVDSSVAAAMLLEAGYAVTGVYGYMHDHGGNEAQTASADARRMAERLGIELRVLDLREEFARVVDYFLAEYAAGRTPNPCLRCNRWIKFGRLVREADSLGIEYVATGHHAQRIDVAGEAAIARAKDVNKDQSYALFWIRRENLPRILFPIGAMENKTQVRDAARKLGLDVYDKPDSQEICFIPGDDYVGFLRERSPEVFRPGEIVNSAGEVLGRHEGVVQYTIGQRRGLRVAGGVPLYVSRIDPAEARVTIGPREEVLTRHLRAVEANWHADVPEEFDAIVQIRYNHRGSAARVRRIGENEFDVTFAENVSAVTPGQAAVVYEGRRLLGGGWIA